MSDRILIAKYQSRLRIVTIVQDPRSNRVSDILRKGTFREQLQAVHKKLRKGDNAIVIGNPNVTAIETPCVRGYGLGDHDINGERFHRLIMR